jgi:predicted aminopeptidase
MRRTATLLSLLLLTACSPVYVLKAGLAEMRILRSRRPIPEVILDSTTDARTRAMLTLAMEAREFARDSLGLDVGDSYTSFTQLRSDTLAMVLSGSRRDRLEPKTWWFPIVGHVPYKGYFELDDALDAQRELEAEGWDTYLRPTSAFSTLGWFADPLLSSLLRADEVDLVETITHELSHNHLFVPSQVTFNESFANFVGRVGSAAFFCSRGGSGPDSVKCARAQARWRDEVRFSRFLDGFLSELRALYGDPALSSEEKIRRRDDLFAAARARFDAEVRPTFEELRFSFFGNSRINNAQLISTMIYYHRLYDFDALLRQSGDLKTAVATLKAGAEDAPDAYTLLPTSDTTAVR